MSRQQKDDQTAVSFTPKTRRKLLAALGHLKEPQTLIGKLEKLGADHAHGLSDDVTKDALYTTRQDVLLGVITKTEALLAALGAGAGTSAWDYHLLPAIHAMGRHERRHGVRPRLGEHFLERVARDLRAVRDAARTAIDRVQKLEDMDLRPVRAPDGSFKRAPDGSFELRRPGGRPARPSGARDAVGHWVASYLAEAPRRVRRRGEQALARERGENEAAADRAALDLALDAVLEVANDRPHAKHVKKLHEEAWGMFTMHPGRMMLDNAVKK